MAWTASIRSDGDLWVYLAYVRSFLDSSELTTADTLSKFYDARMSLSGWLVLQALIAKVSGLEPIDLNSLYLPPLWTAVGLAGFLTLARSLFRREECALLSLALQLVYLSSSLALTTAAVDPGYSLAVRINEDKIAVWLFPSATGPPYQSSCRRP